MFLPRRRVERIVILVAATGAHTVWLAAAFRLALSRPLVRPAGAALPTWAVAGLVAGGHALAWALARRERRHLIGALVGLGALVVAVGCAVGVRWGAGREALRQWAAALCGWEVALPAGAVVALGAALAWGLGTVTGWGEQEASFYAFLAGVVGVGGLLLATPAALEEAGVRAGAVLALYAVLGLVSLALQGVYEAESLGALLGRARPGFSRHWLGALGVTMTLVLLGGWLAAEAVSPDLVRGAWRAAHAAVRPLEGPVLAMLERLSSAWEAIRGTLRRLLALLLARGGPPGTDAEPPLEVERLLRLPQEGESAPSAVGLVMLVVLLIVAAWALGRLGGWLAGLLVPPTPRRRACPATYLDEREAVLSGELLSSQLAALWGRLRARAGPAFLDLKGEEARRRAVRLLYRHFLGRLAAAGLARPPGATPTAHARSIAARLRDERHAVEALTEAYVAARYGPDAPSPETVDAARAAWRTLARGLSDGKRTRRGRIDEWRQ